MVGQLKLCLYGTRDAALNWQETLSQHLIDNGLERDVGFPSVFFAQREGCLHVGARRRLLFDGEFDVLIVA